MRRKAPDSIVILLPPSSLHPKMTALRRRLSDSNTAEIRCHELYLIHPERPIRKEESDCLNQLAELIDVNGGPGRIMSLTEMVGKIKGDVVMPRRGTRSPWSSKAGDVFSAIFPELSARIEKGVLFQGAVSQRHKETFHNSIRDQMLEELISVTELPYYFAEKRSGENIQRVDMQDVDRLEAINEEWGLALSYEELDYLASFYKETDRDATDLELMAYAQLNSEHCRHKVFNSSLRFNQETMPETLFSLIKSTSRLSPLVSAYKDNAAIFVSRPTTQDFHPAPTPHGRYDYKEKETFLVFKAETHNHPTFVSPYPGAATGVGGEIRDELACGRGARSKAGFVGFNVSELLLRSQKPRLWEGGLGTPAGKASGLDIMVQAPLGGSNYGNEYGRPCLGGYFRTLCCEKDGVQFGYHKPLMLAGGWGEITAEQLDKEIKDERVMLIVLGEPALRIGLGGGSVSSMRSSNEQEQLDFASVQRDNAEMGRRCAEVIQQCASLGKKNPIQFIHDLGAGGLGNAVAELLKDNDCGAKILLEAIPIADKTMAAREIWSNESQERFILAIAEKDIETFTSISRRENAPFAVLGRTDPSSSQLRLVNKKNDALVNLPLSLLFPEQQGRRSAACLKQRKEKDPPLPDEEELAHWAKEVLQLPAVASKSFLITIGDRSVGGLTAREQFIGPWQQPVSDYAATMEDYESYSGEASALGERSPVAVINPPAAARLALGETITNLAGAGITEIKDIRLCANWMASVEDEGQLHALYQSVRTVTQDICSELELAIPVGKDSLFMCAEWLNRRVISPISLVMSGLAPVKDLRFGLSPQLSSEGRLWLVSLRAEPGRLGGSALNQARNIWQGTTADLDAPRTLKGFFSLMSRLIRRQALFAYHDCSDGGIWAALCEMAFTANCGINIELNPIMKKEKNVYRALFNEELGAIVQVKPTEEKLFQQLLEEHQMTETVHPLGDPIQKDEILLRHRKELLLKLKMTDLRRCWHSLSDEIRRQRDNPECVSQEASLHGGENRLQERVKFDLRQKYQSISLYKGEKPQLAILRAQGSNGQREMAAAFARAGFSAHDVHINDLLHNEKKSLADYKGLALCGGFSYGDALGGGAGWAASILLNPYLREQFQTFFHRSDSFTLGVCNGCQTLARLAELIPGSDWGCSFLPNLSQRYESRTVMVKIAPCPSIFLTDMQDSLLPIASAHAEGRAAFSSQDKAEKIIANKQAAMFYADGKSRTTQHYPTNPNGSQEAVAALTTQDGRVTLIMPHPERVLRRLAQGWRKVAPNEMKKAREDYVRDGSPWYAMFLNARLWVG